MGEKIARVIRATCSIGRIVPLEARLDPARFTTTTVNFEAIVTVGATRDTRRCIGADRSRSRSPAIARIATTATPAKYREQ